MPRRDKSKSAPTGHRKGKKIPLEGEAASSTSKRAKGDAEFEFEDWRSPLYFWHGTVQTDWDNGVTTWEGTWIASKSGLPSAKEFAESPNTFKLSSSDFLDRDGVRLEDACPFGRSGYFKGSYKLDNDGQGFMDYSDLEHRLVFKNHSGGALLVGARGAAAFGHFVSVGHLTFPTRNGAAILTVARRYITEDDPRLGQSAWATLLHIEEQLEKGRRDGWETPWTLLHGSPAYAAAAENEEAISQL